MISKTYQTTENFPPLGHSCLCPFDLIFCLVPNISAGHLKGVLWIFDYCARQSNEIVAIFYFFSSASKLLNWCILIINDRLVTSLVLIVSSKILIQPYGYVFMTSTWAITNNATEFSQNFCTGYRSIVWGICNLRPPLAQVSRNFHACNDFQRLVKFAHNLQISDCLK